MSNERQARSNYRPDDLLPGPRPQSQFDSLHLKPSEGQPEVTGVTFASFLLRSGHKSKFVIAIVLEKVGNDRLLHVK